MQRKIPSTVTARSTSMGRITAAAPNTKPRLKMLEPIILPIAISFSPFLAATKEVTNSGSDVPSATMVRPINDSLKPNCSAMAVANPPLIAAPNNA